MIKPSEFKNYAILLSTIDGNPAFIKLVSPHNIKALDDAGYLQGKKLSASGREFIAKNLRTSKPVKPKSLKEDSQVSSIFDFSDNVATNPKPHKKMSEDEKIHDRRLKTDANYKRLFNFFRIIEKEDAGHAVSSEHDIDNMELFIQGNNSKQQSWFDLLQKALKSWPNPKPSIVSIKRVPSLYEDQPDELLVSIKIHPEASSRVTSNPKRKPVSKPGQKRVGKKVRKLMHEGYPQKQALAIAYKYERSKNIGPLGGKKNPKKYQDGILNQLLKFSSQHQHLASKIPPNMLTMMEHLGWIKVKNQRASLTAEGRDVIKYVFEGAE